MTSIGDYGFLSDCQTAALVTTGGSVDWLCLPRFDSPAVFARMLGERGGHWALRPVGEHDFERAYVDGTLVLRTRFRTADGEVELTDALLFEDGARGHDIGLEAPHVLARVVRGVRGEVELSMEFAPRLEYGLVRPRITAEERAVWARGGPAELRLTADVALDASTEGATSRFVVSEGEAVAFALAFRNPHAGGGFADLDPAAAIDDTIDAWTSWDALHAGYRGLYGEEVRLSALVLQGLTYQPSGALVAAATTSLPEVLGGDANWDYRFTWLRDASLTLRAQWVAACPDEPERFFRWLEQTGARDGPHRYQIMYGVRGENDLSERELDHLEGFEGSAPVRVGNEAWRQEQLDVMGEVLDAAHLLRETVGGFTPATQELLVALADEAAERWRLPDAGMWEARDKHRHYLSSKVMCWVALERAIDLAAHIGAGDRVAVWAREREAVRAAVLDEGWHDGAGAFTGAFGSDHLDASVLLMPLVGFLDARDERMRATIDAIDDRLGVDGLVRRWPEEPNGFVICSYWLAECLALAGEGDRARERFDAVTACANDLGLLSEMVDVGTGDPLGNTPQAFSHVGLINAAWTISGGSATP